MSEKNDHNIIELRGWQADTLQLINIGQWEEALIFWMKETQPHVLSLWLIGQMDARGESFIEQLLDEMRDWLTEPDEKLRWKIFHNAEDIGFDTPVGALALSLFWSQGSMSPQGLEPIYPEPHLSGVMLHCALLMLVTLNAENPAEGAKRLFFKWINRGGA